MWPQGRTCFSCFPISGDGRSGPGLPRPAPPLTGCGSVDVSLLPASGRAIRQSSGTDASVPCPWPHGTGEAPRHGVLLMPYPTTRLSNFSLYSFAMPHVPHPWRQVIPFLVLILREETLFAELLVYASESRGLQVYFLFNLYKYVVNYMYVTISTEDKGRLWRIKATPGSH